MFNDELDEITARSPSDLQTTYQVNVEDLDSPGVVVASPNNTASTDHNLYIKDDVIYESNYTSGLRLFDGDDVPTDDLREIGYFDVYPENDNEGFEGGTWSNFSLPRRRHRDRQLHRSRPVRPRDRSRPRRRLTTSGPGGGCGRPRTARLLTWS